MHISNLDYGVSNGAWAYIFMHALAKCGLLSLYSVRLFLVLTLFGLSV